MGILYVDECGNSGVTDLSQPFFLYGGIYLDNNEWRKVYQEINALLITERTAIAAKVAASPSTPQVQTGQDGVMALIESYEKNLSFLKTFYFHTTDINRGHGLWITKNLHERFELIRSIIQICKSHNIKIFVGEFDKQKFQANVPKSVYSQKLIEYKMLIPYFFSGLEQISPGEYVLVRASGDLHETALISESLKNTNNFYPDDFIMESKKSPMLQISDAILWTLQAYKRIDLSKQNHTAREREVIATYLLLESCNLHMLKYDPIYV